MKPIPKMPSFPNPIFLQELMYNSHSRRLLLHTTTTMATPSPPPQPHDSSLQPKDNNTFDTNVVMVLSVLLCALICSLGLNSIIRCALRCSSFVATDSNSDSGAVSAARLANTGIKKKALKTFPVIDYTADLKLPGLATECVICLSEFAPGERVKVLPKCHHGFHVRCIDKWLNSHSSCPTCRHCLIETCNKIVGCSQPAIASTSMAPAQEQEVVIRIEPLQREGLIGNHEI